MLHVSDHGPITRVRMARTVFGRSLHEVSAYHLGDLLVDSGPPPVSRAFADWCSGRRIRRVVLTHHHEDHSGGAAELQGRLGLDVAAPESAVPILAEGLRIPLYRRFVWGAPRRFRARPLESVVEAGGARWQVIPTPGHAFTHVCFWDPDRRWLIGGDIYVHPRVKVLRRIEDVGEHMRSLERLIDLDPDLLLCAHAGLVEGATAALRAKLTYWRDLAASAQELHAEGHTVTAVTRRLLGRETGFSAFILGEFSKRNLIVGLLALGQSGTREIGNPSGQLL